MGVQCSDAGSDPPLGTNQNLTSFSTHALAFCYNSATLQASIYIDGALAATAVRQYVFPRRGAVSVLVGSHDSDVDLTEGVTLSSLSIIPLPTTTTTTTTTATTT